MKIYKKILLAVELNDTGDREPKEKAIQFAKEFGAELILVHAIEQVSSYGAAYGVAVGAEVEELLLEGAVKEMQKLGKSLKVSDKCQIVKFGPAKVVILEEAERLDVDLIIVGSHGRHGIRLLLGSTANAVLHAAACDVLAVRLKSN